MLDKLQQDLKDKQEFYDLLRAGTFEELLTYHSTVEKKIKRIRSDYEEYEKPARKREEEIQFKGTSSCPIKPHIPWKVLSNSLSERLTYFALQRQDLDKKIASFKGASANFSKNESEFNENDGFKTFYLKTPTDIKTEEQFELLLNNNNNSQLQEYKATMKKRINNVLLSSENAELIELECIIAIHCQLSPETKNYQKSRFNSKIKARQNRKLIWEQKFLAQEKIQKQVQRPINIDAFPGRNIMKLKFQANKIEEQIECLEKKLNSAQKTGKEQSKDPQINSKVLINKKMMESFRQFYKETFRIFEEETFEREFLIDFEMPKQFPQYLPYKIKRRSEFYAFLKANGLPELLGYKSKIEAEIQSLEVEYMAFEGLANQRQKAFPNTQNIPQNEVFPQKFKMRYGSTNELRMKKKIKSEMPLIQMPNHIFFSACNQVLSELVLQKCELIKKIQSFENSNKIESEEEEYNLKNFQTSQIYKFCVVQGTIPELQEYKAILIENLQRLQKLRHLDEVVEYIVREKILRQHGSHENLRTFLSEFIEIQQIRDTANSDAFRGQMRYEEYQMDPILPELVLRNQNKKKKILQQQLKTTEKSLIDLNIL